MAHVDYVGKDALLSKKRAPGASKPMGGESFGPSEEAQNVPQRHFSVTSYISKDKMHRVEWKNYTLLNAIVFKLHKSLGKRTLIIVSCK